MRIELWSRFGIIDKKIFRETYDEIDEGVIEETFGGRSSHKKRRVRVSKERIFSLEDLDMAPPPKKITTPIVETSSIPARPKKVEQRPTKTGNLNNEDLSFEDKVKRFESTNGSLMDSYRKYLTTGEKPDNLEHVLSQVKKALPFDLDAFADEWKRRLEFENEPSQVHFGSAEKISKELEKIVLKSEVVDTPQLSEDDPLAELVGIADDNEIQVLAQAINALPDLEKTNQRLILQAAIECLKNKTQKNTEGRWRSLYRPLLFRLGVLESVLGPEVV